MEYHTLLELNTTLGNDLEMNERRMIVGMIKYDRGGPFL